MMLSYGLMVPSSFVGVLVVLNQCSSSLPYSAGSISSSFSAESLSWSRPGMVSFPPATFSQYYSSDSQSAINLVMAWKGVILTCYFQSVQFLTDSQSAITLVTAWNGIIPTCYFQSVLFPTDSQSAIFYPQPRHFSNQNSSV